MAYRKSISSFTYQPENKESIIAAMEYALDVSKKHMFSVIEEITDIKSYILTYRGVLETQFDEIVYFALDNYELFYNEECKVIEDRVTLELENNEKLSKERKKERHRRLLSVLNERIEVYRTIKRDDNSYINMIRLIEENKKRNNSQLVILGVK